MHCGATIARATVSLTSARKYTDASNHRPGKLIADVIGVALVEIGLRNARGYLLSRPIHDIAECGHAEDYDTSRANETNAWCQPRAPPQPPT